MVEEFAVTADQVRDRLGLSAEDISDEKVMDFVQDVAAYLGDEVGRTLDYTSCTRSDGNTIKNLAAIHCYCFVSGGSAVGLNFTLGDLHVSEAKGQQIVFLKHQVEQWIRRQRTFAPVTGEYED